jgi:SAM-dependent methyltransferase
LNSRSAIRNSQIAPYLRCARLNLRALRLALTGQWLSNRHLAASYDRVAPYYDDTWQRHLRPVTDLLLAQLPSAVPGCLLDLGCGTGYTTARLAAKYPGQPLSAVDLSEKMLDQARRHVQTGAVSLIQADLLEYLRTQPPQSAGLILSAWAIGYSYPARVIREAGRVLRRGGMFGFVVNLADTLGPVFLAFRRCLARFPDRLAMAAWLRFPKDWPFLRRVLAREGFEICWQEEGFQVIPRPEPGETTTLAWLLKTGVLAGFDAMLPLAEPGPVADYFEQLLHENRDPIRHHYVAVLGARQK